MILNVLTNSRAERGWYHVQPGPVLHLPEYRSGVSPKGRTCATCPTVLSMWNPNPVCHPCAMVAFDSGALHGGSRGSYAPQLEGARG